jgi:hypothetical protein
MGLSEVGELGNNKHYLLQNNAMPLTQTILTFCILHFAGFLNYFRRLAFKNKFA